MRRFGPWLGALLAVALTAGGCGDDDNPSNPGWDGWQPTEDGGVILDAPAVDLGPIPDGLPADPDGPKIEIQTPKEGEVVVADVLLVEAKITDDDGVSSETVQVTLKGRDPEPMVLTSKPDIYQAKLDVSAINGDVLLIIQAGDNVGKESSTSMKFVRDAGPQIKFNAPEEDGRFKSDVSVQVNVADRYGIKSFEARLGSSKLTLKKTQETPDGKQQVWAGTVKFDAFSPPLSGKQVLLAEAVNDNGAKNQATRVFHVDDVGPEISVSSQSPGDLIGGVIQLEAKVTDPAGVLPSSVTCIIGNDLDTRTVSLTAASATPTVYQGQFDTRTLTQYFIWPVMSFRAADKLGNESHLDIQVGLDNGQPIVELDPPTDFHSVREKDQVFQCSHPFDPVGPFAANDLHKVPQIQELRARIEDQGNHAFSAKWVPYATVDQSSAWLYVLDDTSKPLVVDTDGDGFCDDINPEVVPLGTSPQPGEAVAVNLAAVGATGSADFTPSTDPVPRGCGSWGDEADPPKRMCYSVLATKAIAYGVPAEASIYTIPPVVSGAKGYRCLGLPFDFKANNINDGWACVAAVADDQLGNRGVSPPLRLMLDAAWASKVAQPVDSATAQSAPSCTGTLQPDGTVSTKPCAFRNPRDAALPANSSCTVDECPDCSSYDCPTVEFPQMFCHCTARLE